MHLPFQQERDHLLSCTFQEDRCTHAQCAVVIDDPAVDVAVARAGTMAADCEAAVVDVAASDDGATCCFVTSACAGGGGSLEGCTAFLD